MEILIQENGDNKGKEYIINQDEIFIGRSPECFINIEESGISRKHARVFKTDKGVFLEDLGSTNGTFLNNVRISKAVRILNNDKIRFASIVMKYKKISKTEIKEESNEGIVYETKPNHLINLNSLTEETEKKLTSSFQEEKKPLSLLIELGKLISSKLKFEELSQLVTDLIKKVFVVDNCYLFLVDEKNKKIIDGSQFPLSKTILNYVITNKSSVLTSDTGSDERFQDAYSIGAYKIKSAMCVPILSQDNSVMGIIYTDSRISKNIFTKDDLDVLTILASQIAVAFENARLFERIQRETKYRNNLQRFLSPNLVDKIMKEEVIGLGGSRKEVTILFSDIRNFTSISEKLKPEELVYQLNEYLEAMTKIIFKYNGTLDKYMGDGIMAIFGAPFQLDDHAFYAIQASLEMIETLNTLNERWEKEGKFKYNIGIGLNTGEVFVGNIGSSERMDYTAIGDNVNIASRIQVLTKFLKCNILMSEFTYEKVKDRVKVKKFQPIKVKGKEQPIVVYGIVK